MAFTARSARRHPKKVAKMQSWSKSKRSLCNVWFLTTFYRLWLLPSHVCLQVNRRLLCLPTIKREVYMKSSYSIWRIWEIVFFCVCEGVAAVLTPTQSFTLCWCLMTARRSSAALPGLSVSTALLLLEDVCELDMNDMQMPWLALTTFLCSNTCSKEWGSEARILAVGHSIVLFCDTHTVWTGYIPRHESWTYFCISSVVLYPLVYRLQQSDRIINDLPQKRMDKMNSLYTLPLDCLAVMGASHLAPCLQYDQRWQCSESHPQGKVPEGEGIRWSEDRQRGRHFLSFPREDAPPHPSLISPLLPPSPSPSPFFLSLPYPPYPFSAPSALPTLFPSLPYLPTYPLPIHPLPLPCPPTGALTHRRLTIAIVVIVTSAVSSFSLLPP